MQSSKSYRGRSRVSKLETAQAFRDMRSMLRTYPVPAAPKRKYENQWLHRTVHGISHTELAEAAELIDDSHIVKKLGLYTLSLVTPGEIQSAFVRSGRQDIDPQLFVSQLRNALPEVSRESVTAKVSGLHQFGRYVGLDVKYEGAQEERRFINDYISQEMGIRHHWTSRPHISLGKGALETITNLMDIQDALPSSLILGKVLQSK